MRIARIVLIGALLAGALALAGCKGSPKTDAGSASTGTAAGPTATAQTPVSGLVDGLPGQWKMKYTPLSVTGPKRGGAGNTPAGWKIAVYNDDLTITMGTFKYVGKVKQVGSASSKKWHFKGSSSYLGANAEEIKTDIEVDADLRGDFTVIEGVQKTVVTSSLKGHLFTAKYKIRGDRVPVLPF